jgi:mono/diheme cytochrome c family protein
LKILLTILAGLIVAAAGAVGFIYSGIYDVSALEPDNAIVRWALHTTSDHSVDARLGGISVPAGLDAPQAILSGGHLFAENCVVCHGGPGLKPTTIAQGLNPQPPNLFRAARKPWMEEMFRFIKYGVKMTAMPGFGKTYSDEQIWQLAAFLRKAPGMSPEDFAAQTGIGAAEAAKTKAGGGS